MRQNVPRAKQGLGLSCHLRLAGGSSSASWKSLRKYPEPPYGQMHSSWRTEFRSCLRERSRKAGRLKCGLKLDWEPWTIQRRSAAEDILDHVPRISWRSLTTSWEKVSKISQVRGLLLSQYVKTRMLKLAEGGGKEALLEWLHYLQLFQD